MDDTFGRFRLLRLVARGGMAEIWKVRIEGPKGFEKTLALKMLLPELVEETNFIAMLIEEARLVAALVHPNIVQVQEFGQDEGSYYIVMEYVAGSSGSALVKQLRDKGKRLSADIAVYIAAEASRALATHTPRGSFTATSRRTTSCCRIAAP